ncbi:MAG: glycosyl transferase [Gammaproteobacteria bacterium]|nr:glycosyl transferase [Gammaproteobacteria bacterium]
MADFHQTGAVATLHNLSQRPIEYLEAELTRFAKYRPMGLVLPSLYSELGGPALDNIVMQLTAVPYLNQIVVGLDVASESEFRKAIEFFDRLPQHHRILWNDGPRLRAVHERLQQEGLAPEQPGKGRNVWYCYGYVLATRRAESIALHDCDIVTYDRSLLARLIYPVANTRFNFEFCKGYYARVGSNALNGRVSRLLVTPMIRTLQQIVGPNEYLSFMDSFRYPLAGEFSLRRDVINDLRIPSDWGLEIGVLSEMNRNYAANRLCQADIADNYDHKHQILSPEDSSRGLSKMSVDIMKSFFRKLATQGVTFSTDRFRTIKATYYRQALDFVEMFEADAIMNGFSYDRHAEEQAVELFASNIVEAGQVFLDKPNQQPFIAPWNRVLNAMPDILEALYDAVEEDWREFGGRTEGLSVDWHK